MLSIEYCLVVEKLENTPVISAEIGRKLDNFNLLEKEYIDIKGMLMERDGNINKLKNEIARLKEESINRIEEV